MTPAKIVFAEKNKTTEHIENRLINAYEKALKEINAIKKHELESYANIDTKNIENNKNIFDTSFLP